MKQNFAPNAELGELLALLQETVQVCGKHLTDRVICQCTGMSSKTYTALKRGSVSNLLPYYTVICFYLDELIARKDSDTLRIVLKELYERLKLDYCNR